MLFISLRVLLVLFLFIYILTSIYLVFDHGSDISVDYIIVGLRIWLISCIFFFYSFRPWFMYLVEISHFLCLEFIRSFELRYKFHTVGYVSSILTVCSIFVVVVVLVAPLFFVLHFLS